MCQCQRSERMICTSEVFLSFAKCEKKKMRDETMQYMLYTHGLKRTPCFDLISRYQCRVLSLPFLFKSVHCVIHNFLSVTYRLPEEVVAPLENNVFRFYVFDFLFSEIVVSFTVDIRVS